MDNNKKGDRGERELVNDLSDAGFAVMRAPASGSATKRELPDVFAGRGGEMYAFEAKASGGDVVYIKEEKVDGLVYFSKNFGAAPRIGVRFDEEPGDPSYGEDWNGWYFFHPDDLYRTGGGNYRVKKAVALEDGTPITVYTG